jgi:Arc/MetJ-type ribon-helix-helix transcriptional regulator
MAKWLGALLVMSIIIIAYFSGLWQNKDKIQHAELELQRMRFMRDSLKVEVNLRDTLQVQLKKQVVDYKNEAESLRDKVDMMQEKRKEEQFSIRHLQSKEDLQARLLKTFPEACTKWRVTELEVEGIGLEFLLVPLWFSETFIIDHQNSISYKAQRDTMFRVDSLKNIIVVLQDSINILEHLNRLAYERGFEYTFLKYDSLNHEYINELKKGKLNWGWQTAGIIGGGVVGFLLGRD